MDSIRVNLDSRKPVYISLTLILLILSGVGVFLLFQIINTRNLIKNSNTPEVQTVAQASPTLIPTIIDTPTATITGKISPTLKLSPTLKPQATPSAKLSPTASPTATLKTTPIPSITSTPLSGPQNFSSTTDKFSIEYSSSRKLYQDKEASGNRYTLSSSLGNFAVHVGLDGKWAWVHSGRTFSNNFPVAGQPTFRYEISTQTIVDLQYDGKNYTIQCIHNGKENLKTECQKFIEDFKLL